MKCYLHALVLLFWLSTIAVASPDDPPIACDVCVVGGGSAGIGCSLAAARAGASVVLVEKNDWLGGTSTAAYVCRWEPGPGCSLAREIFGKLDATERTVGITWRTPTKFGALLTTDPELTYDDSLRRAGLSADKFHAVVYEPQTYHQVAWKLLAETGNCRVMLGTTFTEATAREGHVDSILATSADGSRHRIRAKVFVDCTGGGNLCRKAGFDAMLGAESRERFGEPHAPEAATDTLNAISLCYRVTNRADAPTAPLPDREDPTGWHRVASVHQLPGGDRIVNPLPLLPGRAIIDMGYAKAYETATARAAAHWRWLSTFPEFEGYRLHSFAPMLGIRESYRIKTEYVLTEHDLVAGLSNQRHTDVIAIADHPMDTHGSGGGLRGVTAAYGIPYRCLVPKGSSNVLVAGRCAGYSHLAASSCRLSRTMMATGHAAGLAAAEAAREGKSVREIDVAALKQAMGVQEPE